MAILGCAVTHSLPLDNVERIEVVRGPASVLYGSESLGTVINVITKEARKSETDATASYGNYNTQQYLLRHGDGRFISPPEERPRKFRGSHIRLTAGGV
jgi:outer membrane cobalamin receptor